MRQLPQHGLLACHVVQNGHVVRIRDKTRPSLETILLRFNISTHLLSLFFLSFFIQEKCTRAVQVPGSICARKRLARISHKPKRLIRNPLSPQVLAVRASTRRWCALLRAGHPRKPLHQRAACADGHPERQRRKSMESKPVGRISHSAGEKCGLVLEHVVKAFSFHSGLKKTSGFGNA